MLEFQGTIPARQERVIEQKAGLNFRPTKLLYRGQDVSVCLTQITIDGREQLVDKTKIPVQLFEELSVIHEVKFLLDTVKEGAVVAMKFVNDDTVDRDVYFQLTN